MEKYRANPGRYDLVLLDLTMPHMDGEETFRQLRLTRPDVKVVLMSGYNEQEAVGPFIGKGLAGFVQKPFEIGRIIRALRQVLEEG
jgi:CheY-like chemotaxis protein